MQDLSDNGVMLGISSPKQLLQSFYNGRNVKLWVLDGAQGARNALITVPSLSLIHVLLAKEIVVDLGVQSVNHQRLLILVALRWGSS